MPNGITLDPIEVETRVDEAFAAEGYTLDNGQRDVHKMQAVAYQAFRTAKVLSIRDKDEKAITRNSLITAVFPNLAVPVDTGRDARKRTTDPAALIAIEVWKEIDRAVWNLTTPGPAGHFQARAMADLGNGYVVCRTKAGVDRVDAAYVTDNMQCIDLDYFGPDDAALQRINDRITRKRAMVAMIRDGADQQHILTGYDRLAKAVSVTGHDKIVQAIEASRPADEADEGDED